MVIDNTPQLYRHRRERNRNRQPRNPVVTLIAGAVLAIYGFGLLLENIGFGDMRHYVHQAWPAILVVVGITLLIHRDANRNRYGFWGTALMFAGVWVYASQHDWIHLSFWSLVGPTVLVLIGAKFVYRAIQRYDEDRHVVLRRY
jgi:cell wall-active antibiotic response 4TMS protein YvqF